VAVFKVFEPISSYALTPISYITCCLLRIYLKHEKTTRPLQDRIGTNGIKGLRGNRHCNRQNKKKTDFFHLALTHAG
jgi:hypothetical protein